MSTFSNTAREVEMPNGDIVKLHDAVTPNSTSNIKKFKYDDNGHVTESEAANATDLNLNSYATPTSGTTAIGTSDNVQTAIGKLDHQSHIDQTNILYGIKYGGGRNLLGFDLDLLKTVNTLGSWSGNVYTYNGVTYTINSDSTITVSAGSTHAYSYLKFCDQNYDMGNRKRFLDNSPLYLTGGVSADVYMSVYAASGSGSIDNKSDTDTAVTFTNTENNYNVSIGVAENKSASATIKPMLRSQTITDRTYQPYGKSNSDLTVLEAEDRAALAEEIDAGAKNQLKLNGTQLSVYGLTVTWDYDNGTVKINGTVSGTTDPAAYIHLGSWTAPADGYYKLYAENANSSDIYVYNDATWGTSPASTCDTVRYFSKGTSFGHIYLRVANGYTVNNVTIKPMICTLADWKVSQKHVPYRPNWDLVVSTLNTHAAQIAAITPNTTYNVAYNVTTSNAYELVSNLYVDVPSGKRVFITVGAKKSNPIGIAICTGNTYAGNIVVMQNEITSAQAMISVSGIYDNGDNNLTQRLYVFMKSQTSMAIQSRVTLSWWYI